MIKVLSTRGNESVNWRGMQELLDHLIQIAQDGKEWTFVMGQWLCQRVDPDQRRDRRDETCQTAGCIAGHVAIMHGKSINIWDVPTYARDFLELEGVEAAIERFCTAFPASSWIFLAVWHPRVGLSWTGGAEVSLNDTIAYLRKAIKARDVFVSLTEDEINPPTTEVPRERE